MKVNTPLVSVIVPIYNAEKYLKECLQSISNQSYSNIEVLLINDGSTDKSQKIAEIICNKDKRFRLVNQINLGVAATRQKGIDISTGDLLIHTDADDIVPKLAFEKLVNRMVSQDSDIVVGGYIVKYAKKEVYAGISENETYQGFVEGLLSTKYHGSLCNKLIKRELYDLVSFDRDINYMEDKLILAKMLSNGPYKMSFLDETVYIYRQNKQSTTSTMSMASIESSVVVIDKISKIYKGQVDESIINEMVKKRRIFKVIESGKKGFNFYSEKDNELLEGMNLSASAKLEWWLIKKNMLRCLRITSIAKITLFNLIH